MYMITYFLQVYIGTSQGDIMVMDVQGNPVTRVQISANQGPVIPWCIFVNDFADLK